MDLLKNKRVLVVGNGKRAEHLPSSYYEDVDTVVRFNKGIKDGYADIWAPTGIFSRKELEYYLTYRGRAVYFNYENRWFPDGVDYISAPYDWVLEAKEELKSKMLFSGTLFLWVLLNKYRPSSVEIIGFDNFRNIEQFNPHQKWKHLDMQWIQKQIVQGRITAL